MKVSTWLRIVVWLTIVAVLAIFIAPAVDLPETALRAKQGAELFFLFLTLAGTVLAMRLSAGTATRPLGRCALCRTPGSLHASLSYPPELIIPLLR